MTNRVPVYDLLVPLCERLGLEPNFTRRIDIHTNEVVAEVYEKDENGAKFIRDDGSGGREIAINELHIPVWSHERGQYP